MLQKCFGTLLQICAATQSCLGALRTIGLVFALTCLVNSVTLKDKCVPFQIMFNQLNLPHVESNQVVETSQDATELNFESHSKVSEYIHK